MAGITDLLNKEKAAYAAVQAKTSALPVAIPGNSQAAPTDAFHLRAGAAVHDSYAIIDTLTTSQPVICGAATLTTVACGIGIWKRKSAEARVLYSGLGLASILIAWLTRPDFLRSTPTAVAPGAEHATGPGAMQTVANFLDRRAASLAAQDPQFASRSLKRLAGDTGADQIPGLAMFL